MKFNNQYTKPFKHLILRGLIGFHRAQLLKSAVKLQKHSNHIAGRSDYLLKLLIE